MTNLKGTPKQIAWAEEIKENLLNQVNETTIPQIQHLFTSNTDKVKNFINELKSLQTTNNYLNNQIVIFKVREIIENEENAATFIENQSLISFLKKALK